MFDEIITTLGKNGNGIQGFSKAAEIARVRATGNPDLAAAWILLARIAEIFVERNERQPLQTTECDRWFDLMRAETERLDAAFGKSDPAELLKAINQTARTLGDQEA